jgi:hypothetical protein
MSKRTVYREVYMTRLEAVERKMRWWQGKIGEYTLLDSGRGRMQGKIAEATARWGKHSHRAARLRRIVRCLERRPAARG